MVFGIDDALLGALISAGGSLAGGLLSSGGDKQKKIPTMNKQQQGIFNEYLKLLSQMQQGGLQNSLGNLQQWMDPNSLAYQDFEQPYLTEFNEQTLPRLAEQFAGGAQGGALSSSGFAQALGGAAAGLKSNLAGLKSNRAFEALKSYLQQYNQMANQGFGTSPFAYKNQQGRGPSNFDFSSLGNVFSNMNFQGFGSKPKYPLTSGYDTMFRQQGVF